MLGDYDDVIDFIVTNGRVVGPRGKTTREVCGVTLTMPSQYVIARKDGNMRLTALETTMLLSGIFDLDLIAKVTTPKAVEMFSKQSDYGPRLFEPKNLSRAMTCLREDLHTRRAIAYLNNRDQPADDIACTTSVQFLYRGNSLNLFVSMRSWDAVFGLPADFFMFANLLMYVADRFKINAGNVIVHATSLHIYDDTAHLAVQESIMEMDPQFMRNDWTREMFLMASERLAARKTTTFDVFCLMPTLASIKPIDIVGI